ncbi:hypothetical protein ACFLUO_07225 [Chloroflexota bacterium]
MDYETSLEVINKLEAIRSNHLGNGTIARNLATFIAEYDHRGTLSLDYINKIVEAIIASNLDEDSQQQFKITPQSIMNSEIAENNVSDLVKDTRLRLLSTEEPSFVDLDGVIDWLKKFALDVKKTKLIPSTDEMGSVQSHQRTVFAGLTFELENDSPLSFLFQRIDIIGDHTGATRGSVIMHILAGGKLILRPYLLETTIYKTSLKSGKWFDAVSLQIKIANAPSYIEMQRLYKDLRIAFGSRRIKEFNIDHIELLHYINNNGGPPVKEKVKFWDNMRLKWNEAHPEHKYATWRGLKRAYNLILLKIEGRSPHKSLQDQEKNKGDVIRINIEEVDLDDAAESMKRE